MTCVILHTDQNGRVQQLDFFHHYIFSLSVSIGKMETCEKWNFNCRYSRNTGVEEHVEYGKCNTLRVEIVLSVCRSKVNILYWYLVRF